MRLPPEQYCLTGAGWNLREEWDEGDEQLNDAVKRERTGDFDSGEPRVRMMEPRKVVAEWRTYSGNATMLK